MFQTDLLHCGWGLRFISEVERPVSGLVTTEWYWGHRPVLLWFHTKTHLLDFNRSERESRAYVANTGTRANMLFNMYKHSSNSLTLCLRVQVHYWSREASLWTGGHYRLETLACPPLDPHQDSSWEGKRGHWLSAHKHRNQDMLFKNHCPRHEVNHRSWMFLTTDDGSASAELLWFTSCSGMAGMRRSRLLCFKQC